MTNVHNDAPVAGYGDVVAYEEDGCIGIGMVSAFRAYANACFVEVLVAEFDLRKQDDIVGCFVVRRKYIDKPDSVRRISRQEAYEHFPEETLVLCAWADMANLCLDNELLRADLSCNCSPDEAAQSPFSLRAQMCGPSGNASGSGNAVHLTLKPTGTNPPGEPEFGKIERRSRRDASGLPSFACDDYVLWNHLGATRLAKVMSVRGDRSDPRIEVACPEHDTERLGCTVGVVSTVRFASGVRARDLEHIPEAAANERFPAELALLDLWEIHFF
jgi:hypothetical protein